MFRIGALLFLASVIDVKAFDRYNYTGYTPLLDGRIVGGQVADIKDFPHQISLQYDGWHACGGSVYKSNIIVTAAHCIGDVTKMQVVAGASRFAEVESKQSISVKKAIQHGNYSWASINNDIAILVLNGHLEFNDKVQPIALATSRPSPGSKVTTTGWGRTDVGSPDVLQQVEVAIVSQKDCTEAYSNLIMKEMICAADKNGGKDSCQGDSGGPLTYGNELVGVVSWGHGCGVKGFPGVYASVPDLHDWVVKTAKKYEE